MKIINGDCLKIMPDLPDNLIDMVLADPPYGTTNCRWDSIIPLEPMWEQLKRIIIPNGVIAMTASQPFTTTLIASNLKMFKYEWIWKKTKAGNFVHVRNMPLKLHENIVIFSDGKVKHTGQKNRMPYNPQGVVKVDKDWKRPQKYESEHNYKRPSHMLKRKITQEGFPSSIISIGSEHNPLHPTQKPVALGQYLIRTYTNEGNTVLDFAAGSGSFGVATILEKRNFIGIEKNKEYFKTMKERIKKVQKEIDAELF